MGLNARSRPAARRAAVVATAALLTIASLSLLAWSKLAGEPAIAAGSTATIDGLTIDVRSSEWAELTGHVMDGQGGYVMPDQMMPGAPTGNEVRLGVSVILTNTRSATEAFNLLDEFTMTGGLETEPHPLSADTIGDLNRLGPGAAMQGTLYFDVEVPDQPDPQLPPLYLQWTRDGSSIRIPVQLPGELPEHHH